MIEGAFLVALDGIHIHGAELKFAVSQYAQGLSKHKMHMWLIGVG